MLPNVEKIASDEFCVSSLSSRVHLIHKGLAEKYLTSFTVYPESHKSKNHLRNRELLLMVANLFPLSPGVCALLGLLLGSLSYSFASLCLSNSILKLSILQGLVFRCGSLLLNYVTFT